ncbi:MAG: alpha/beta fold hydrolase [archaeon]|nr:alpha/beta fold hydrolase [archaeon]
MQNPEQFPETIELSTTLGYFILRCSERVYEGCANGFAINLAISPKKVGFHYEASLFSTEEKYAFEMRDIEGDFENLDDILPLISAWTDNASREAVEAFDKDVQYLDTPYGRLAFWSYNTHLDTTPLVFVHGGPGGDSNPVKARRLHLKNPVYLFDQMGCGMSDPIRDLENFDLKEYFEEMSMFIDSIPAEKVVLVGASWGSGLSLYYSGLSGFRKVAGLILPSPFLSTAKWTEDAILNLKDMGGDYLERFTALAEKKDYGEEFTRILGEYNARYLFNRSIFRDYGLVSAQEVPNEVFQKLCGPNDLITDGKLLDFDVTCYLKDINVPTLLMCADSDEVRIDRIMEFYRQVKGARLSIIPHAGHVLALEQFDSYRDAIKAFIEENGF